jgi:hypothetical protein
MPVFQQDGAISIFPNVDSDFVILWRSGLGMDESTRQNFWNSIAFEEKTKNVGLELGCNYMQIYDQETEEIQVESMWERDKNDCIFAKTPKKWIM